MCELELMCDFKDFVDYCGCVLGLISAVLLSCLLDEIALLLMIV